MMKIPKNKTCMDPDINSPRRYNHITEDAIQEARDIIAGKIPAESYTSFQDILDDIEKED